METNFDKMTAVIEAHGGQKRYSQIIAWLEKENKVKIPCHYGSAANEETKEPLFIILAPGYIDPVSLPSLIGDWKVVITDLSKLDQAATDTWIRTKGAPTSWQVPASGPAVDVDVLSEPSEINL